MKAVKPQESRAFKGTVEVRQGPSGPMIVGYAAVFNSDSSDMGFIEQVDPGAFTKTVQESDVRGLGNHDCNWLLGRAKAGTCRVSTDSTGLYYEIDVNQSDPDGQRALAKVQRGDWDGSSFSFSTVRDEWNWETSPPQRRLLEVALIDVGPVTYPAYPDATATSRALQPVADKIGRPVGELVSALARGEIRSIITGGTIMDETVETPPDEETVPDDASEEVEERSGKMISQKNLDMLQGVHDNLSQAAAGLRELIDVAKAEAPEDSKVTPFAEVPDVEDARGLSVLAAQLDVRRRVQALEVA